MPGAARRRAKGRQNNLAFSGNSETCCHVAAVEELLSGPTDATGRLRLEFRTQDGSAPFWELHGRSGH